MPVSSEKNFEQKLKLFEEWLSQKENYINKKITVTPHVSSQASGFSNETFSCLVEGKNIKEDIVLRIKPTGFQVFPEYNLAMQIEIMRKLRSIGFMVPEITFHERDENIIGAEFYVMKHIKGEAPSDTPPYHMDPEGMMGRANTNQIRSVWLDWLENLSSLHKLDLNNLNLKCMHERMGEECHLQKDLDFYKNFLEWGLDGEKHEVCEEVLEWLSINIPKDLNPTKLCWGDARIGNILFNDFKAVALLDWEMATIGDPLSDLAWGLTTDDASSFGLSIEKIKGSMPQKEALEIWEKKTGYSTKNFFYFRILCLFKFSVIMVRVAKKLIYNEIMPLDSDFHVNNHISNYLKKEFYENN